MHPYIQSLPPQPSLHHRRMLQRGIAVLAFIAALIIAAMLHVV